MIKQIFTFLLIFLVLFACNNGERLNKEIAKVDIDLRVDRFDREFAKAEPKDLVDLRTKYPYLFPAPDSVWTAKLKDSLQIELRGEVTQKFPDFKEETQDLKLFFKHVKYYFPEFKIPKIITVTNNVDYENRIIYADSLLLIGLDNYLGPKHKYYQRFSKYITQNLDRQFLVSDVADGVVGNMVPRPKDRSFISRMLYYGKQLYLKDKFIPFATDAQKIGYSQDEFEWAQMNEEPIWRNFVEQEYLYSTDAKLGPRFLDHAPFSKFGLELDNESPGRIGRYIGWKIVRAFMDNNEVSLTQMLNLPPEALFKKSNYKPKK